MQTFSQTSQSEAMFVRQDNEIEVALKSKKIL